ncbi:MAG: biliverdin-producing heme oxygenase [Nostoc sp.]|uniref:biliverdin-producing heme oxygenase n=1 Tax=Nostoc sp. TaxID=1180 RepID=UPI002FFAC12B
MSSNLAIKLRSGTQQAHTSAENVGFMKCFLKGVVDRDCNALEQIPDKKAFKDKYRQALNALPVDDITAERIVAEANNAFGFNLQMAQELEGSLIKALGQVLFNSLTRSQNSGSTEVA